jgi:hypothetical protein
MAKADLSEYARKYEIFRHHAWAGTAFLSILLALRYFIAEIPRYIFIPLGTLLIVYILIAVLNIRTDIGRASPKKENRIGHFNRPGEMVFKQLHRKA